LQFEQYRIPTSYHTASRHTTEFTLKPAIPSLTSNASPSSSTVPKRYAFSPSVSPPKVSNHVLSRLPEAKGLVPHGMAQAYNPPCHPTVGLGLSSPRRTSNVLQHRKKEKGNSTKRECSSSPSCSSTLVPSSSPMSKIQKAVRPRKKMRAGTLDAYFLPASGYNQEGTNGGLSKSYVSSPRTTSLRVVAALLLLLIHPMVA
jgi:hypothetical protein